jgi:hypothetical protein
MGESFKAVVSLFVIIALIVALIAWIEDRPDQTTWIVRASSLAVAAALVAVLIKRHFRRDLAPDYLHDACGVYFNRGGFCFAFATEIRDGVCQFRAYYQNQFDRRCLGRIALQPARGFFLNRPKIDVMTFAISAEPGAYGVVTLPIPLPPEAQGKTQTFEVGASVEYPEGRGNRLRFRDGVFVRANSNFGNAFGTALTVAGALGGAIVFSSPATVEISLPPNVAETVPTGQTRSHVIWKLGDSPITTPDTDSSDDVAHGV